MAAEFKYSMQAIVAAATAIDAFYSNVQSRVQIDREVKQAWRKGRAKRPAVVAETLRTAFAIKQENFDNLSSTLHQVYQFRDNAVHPSGKLTDPVLHPGMRAGVEWRFVAFSFDNAFLIVQAATEIIAQLATKGHPTNKKLQDYCRYLNVLVSPLRPLS